jgi:hypothetical protein
VSARIRRRLGLGLMAYGTGGLLLLLVGLFALLSSPLPGELDLSLANLSAATQTMDRAEAVVADAARTARSARIALASTSMSSRSAASMMTELAATLRETGTSLRVDIFGSRPFASVADSFDRTAQQADGVTSDLQSTAANVDEVARELDSTATELDQLGSTLAAGQAGAVAMGGAASAALRLLAPWLALVAALFGFQALAVVVAGAWLYRSEDPAAPLNAEGEGDC